MYARRVGEQEVTFDFAEGLLQNNLLFVDRETSSIWSQLHGQAVSGPLEGTPLQVVASPCRRPGNSGANSIPTPAS